MTPECPRFLYPSHIRIVNKPPDEGRFAHNLFPIANKSTLSEDGRELVECSKT
jgi:hypothetical protein